MTHFPCLLLSFPLAVKMCLQEFILIDDYLLTCLSVMTKFLKHFKKSRKLWSMLIFTFFLQFYFILFFGQVFFLELIGFLCSTWFNIIFVIILSLSIATKCFSYQFFLFCFFVLFFFFSIGKIYARSFRSSEQKIPSSQLLCVHKDIATKYISCQLK